MQVKKNHFKFLLSIIAISMSTIAFTGSAKAQAPGGMQMQSPEERAAYMSTKMKTELNLTDAQYPQVQGINLKYAQKADSLFKAPGEREEKMPVMQSLQQAKGSELESILTPEQNTKYQAMVKEMLDKAKAKHRD